MSRIFDQVVGHKKQIEVLLGAVRSGRVAPTSLFVGPSGIGKKLVATGLAQALICPEAEEACGQCPSCIRIAKGQSESVFFVSPQNHQIKIDQARQLIQFFSLRNLSQARVAIVDEAELLNVQAANALLKTLEEPPKDSHIILLAGSATSVLSTIRSRSQVQRFATLSREELKTLTGEKDWVIEAAQGRASRVEQLKAETMDDLRSEAFAVWQKLVESPSSSLLFDQLKELAKDKQQSLTVVQLWQQLLRDSRFSKDSLTPIIHQDFITLIHELSAQPGELLDEWGKGCFELEKEILGNLDRSLCFEAYFRKAQQQVVAQ